MRIPKATSTLILASASPARRALLREAGVRFEVIPADVQEHAGRGLGLRRTVLVNARRKALAVARRFPGRWVLGADTMISFEGKLLGKPQSVEETLRLHLAMGGKEHFLATGVCLARDRASLDLCVVTRLRVRTLPVARLRSLYRRSDPRGMAGGYAVRESDDPLIERIEGSFTNVLGLPMEAVLPLLEERGLAGRGAVRPARRRRATPGRSRGPSRASRGPSLS